MSSWLVAEGLCFAHAADRPLIENIHLTINDERVALIGSNGAGKTTLLRLLTGALVPQRGHIARRGRQVHWPQMPEPGQVVGDVLPPDDPGRAAALSRLGLPPEMPDDLPLSRLSGGQVARLHLAAIRLIQPDMLILDEPGNDLDADGRASLADLIRNWRGGLLLVSHELGLLSLADRILDLSPLGLRSHGGGYQGWQAARQAERRAAERALVDAQKQARRAQVAVRETEARAARRARAGKQAKARGSNAPILMGQRRDKAEQAASARRIKGERQQEAADHALEQARRGLPPPPPPLDMAVNPTGVPAGKMLLRAVGLSLSRNGRPLWQNVSFEMTGPARLALTGRNGVGKSSLLDCLDGRLCPDTGTLTRAPHLQIARLDQRLAAPSDATPLSLARLAHKAQGEGETRAALARFGFRAAAAEMPLRLLSGGMRVRAHLCAALGGAAPPQVLLLDEPANHLDLEGRAALLEALSAYDGALVLVSHDPDFRRAVGVTQEIQLG
ncbi:hypothetical protein CHU95_07960 [Niveispirillum lacus]|uniref:ABC transporter domain-containing protein n=1 Tax=Niveispirillum lacus TaxID=1981099 RepID=A0A255Z131_9PROT|nr:ATP-binding cassette domain-containing protein [Niveispirillum lacus]OYQ35162.1 hypothetical protein CHU95_07960 [Niveispirillum lacus]